MDHRHAIDRRTVVGGALALAAMLPAPARALRHLDRLAAAARGEGPIVWYQTSPLDQIAPFTGAFEARFPGARLAPVRLVGGTDMGARIVQEIQAGAPTADAGTGGRESVAELAKRGLLMPADWRKLGVPAELIGGDNTVATAAGIHLILSNEQQVPAAEAPRNWEDLLDRRWSGGRLALWASSSAFANLAKQWGEERAAVYVERIAAQEPLLFRSMYNLAQAIAAGEALAGVATYLTVLPVLRAGAPVRFELGDPVSISTLSSFAVATSPRPNATRLLLAWIGSQEGATAFEEATGTGVHRPYPTKTAALVAGRAISEFGPDEQDRLVSLRHRFNLILQKGGGQAR